MLIAGFDAALAARSATGSLRVACLLAFVAACTSDPGSPETTPRFGPPVATLEALTYVDHVRREVLFVRPGDEALDVHRVPLDEEDTRVLWTVATRDRADLLVLTGPVSEKAEDIDERLYRYPANGEGEPTVYDVGSAFKSIALSPDHRRAVLFGASGQLNNANAVSIVDLSGESGIPVRSFSLEGFGDRVASVQFPAQTEEGVQKEVMVGGKTRDIVAFLAPTEIVLVDAADSTANQVSYKFENGFAPAGTLLRDANQLDPHPRLFVRSVSDTDVTSLTLLDKAANGGAGVGFTVQPSFIDVGEGVTDFVTHDQDDDPFLITVGGRNHITFTHIQTNERFSVELASAVSKLRLRDTQDGQREVVAWIEGGNAIHRLPLEDIASTIGRMPKQLSIRGAIGSFVQLDADRALIGSGADLFVVSFPDDQVTPLRSMAMYDVQSAIRDGDHLVVGSQGSSSLSSFDLRNPNPETMLLDAPLQSLHRVVSKPSDGEGQRSHAMVVHNDAVGLVTVAEAQAPKRKTSYVARGFLLDGVLDR